MGGRERAATFKERGNDVVHSVSVLLSPIMTPKVRQLMMYVRTNWAGGRRETLPFSYGDFNCRRMFPTVRCSFTNLRPDRKYWVLLDIVPCDNKRYRYAYHRSSWLVAGKADPPPPHRFYPHPDAPYTGEQLRKQVVSFEKVKLTNNEMDKTGQVSFSSPRAFLPS